MKKLKRMFYIFFYFIFVLTLPACSHYWGSSGGISYSFEDAKENCEKYGKVPKITAQSSYHDIGYICVTPSR